MFVCGTTPMTFFAVAGCATTSMPPTDASPDVGITRVVNMPTVVVLPAPFGPSNPKISPRRTLRVQVVDRAKLPTATVELLREMFEHDHIVVSCGHDVVGFGFDGHCSRSYGAVPFRLLPLTFALPTPLARVACALAWVGPDGFGRGGSTWEGIVGPGWAARRRLRVATWLVASGVIVGAFAITMLAAGATGDHSNGGWYGTTTTTDVVVTTFPHETTAPYTTAPYDTTVPTTVPETTVPETTVPETTVPETATTVPETATTVPETATTVPETVTTAGNVTTSTRLSSITTFLTTTSSTIGPQGSTSTVGPQGSTSTTAPLATTTTLVPGSPANMPMTGGSAGTLLLFGVVLIAAGGVLGLRSRRIL